MASTHSDKNLTLSQLRVAMNLTQSAHSDNKITRCLLVVENKHYTESACGGNKHYTDFMNMVK